MKMHIAVAALTLLAGPLGAQQRNNDPDQAVQGGGTLPAGWSARTDRDAPLTNVKFVTMGPTGLHVTTGPAVILWKDADKGTGGFHTEATFTQTKAPTHAEAYGIFVGGKDLKGAGQYYAYFVVRQDGKFLIRIRDGAGTKNVTEGWTDHAAVVKAGADGKATNRLEILVGKDKVTFSANGTEVYSMPAAAGSMDGIVG
ncbi:MAG TPA: hypothetical protein VLL51_06740, partial [Gemmatimonadales bacterium]|nr:hypothetical protein [Gemmatimonadales bacterium]